MITEAMETRDLIETLEQNAYREILNADRDDPKRKEMWDEAVKIAGIRSTYDQNEQNRLNNNTRNDIEESKIVVESEKAKNDRKRIRMDVIKFTVGSTLALIGGIGGHFLDGLLQKSQNVQRVSDRIQDWTMKK